MVPKTMMDKWRAMCPTPPRFARALLRTVFTAEELKGSSLHGQPSNLRPGVAPKPALDKKRVDAVISRWACTLAVTYSVGLSLFLSVVLNVPILIKVPDTIF